LRSPWCFYYVAIGCVVSGASLLQRQDYHIRLKIIRTCP
jgi:hypothetical protein